MSQAFTCGRRLRFISSKYTHQHYWHCLQTSTNKRIETLYPFFGFYHISFHKSFISYHLIWGWRAAAERVLFVCTETQQNQCLAKEVSDNDKRNHNRLGMTSLAEIHSPPCSTPQAVWTTVGYSLHRKTTPVPGEKPSQLLASETCWALMSSESQLPWNWCQYFRKHEMPLWEVCW